MPVTRCVNESADVFAPGCTAPPPLEDFDWSNSMASKQEIAVPMDIVRNVWGREVSWCGTWLAHWLDPNPNPCPIMGNPLNLRGGGR